MSRNVNKPLDFHTNSYEHTYCERPNGFGAGIIGDLLQNTSHFFILPVFVFTIKKCYRLFSRTPEHYIKFYEILYRSNSMKSCTVVRNYSIGGPNQQTSETEKFNLSYNLHKYYYSRSFQNIIGSK